MQIPPIAYSLDYQMSEWLDSKTIANHPKKNGIIKSGEQEAGEEAKKKRCFLNGCFS